MTTASRILLAALLLPLSLTGCDIFDKKKPPLTGERIAVFSDRQEIEPDKDAASIQVTLPAPVVNDSWPQSGGFANYAMQHLAIGDSPQVVWTADVGSGSSSSRILTTPPVVADGKVFAKDAESTVSAYDRRHRPEDLERHAQAREGARHRRVRRRAGVVRRQAVRHHRLRRGVLPRSQRPARRSGPRW